MIESLLQLLGIKSLATSVAGLIGGILSLRFFEELSVSGKISTVVGGWACANYGTPIMIEFYKLETTGYHAGVAFATGLFGMSIIAAVFQVIRTTNWSERFHAVLDRFLPGKGGGQ